jgi:two-component sensor histidine kinase
MAERAVHSRPHLELEERLVASDNSDRTVDKLRRQQAALAQFGSFAFKERDLSKILAEAARVCAASLGVPYCKICRHRAAENDLLIEAGCGWDLGVVGRVVSQADETSPQGRAFVTAYPVIIRDVRNTNNLALPDFYSQHGIVSTIDVVIAALDGAPYGVLEIDSPTLHQYDQYDINFLTGFANVLAEAVASAQKNKVMQALLDRQTMLASELHHRVRNNLHMVTGMLDNYARSALDNVSRQGIGSISRHVVTLSHVYDGLLGVGLASTIDLGIYLEKLCVSLPKLQDGQAQTIDFECHAESIVLSLDSVTALGMTVAELVNNSYRHAFPDDREGRIIVTLDRVDVTNAILMIQDDGVGFDTTAASLRRGLGLVRELVEQIGGTADVRSEVGTLWTLIFPVPDSADGLKAAA